MDKNRQESNIGLQEIGLSLGELVRRGARQIVQQAVEAELAVLLAQYENVKTLHGQKAVVRNGYLPERDILTGAAPVAVRVPKVRDRCGNGVKFNSVIAPPYIRKSPRVSAALPWLYLKGISTGDMEGESPRAGAIQMRASLAFPTASAFLVVMASRLPRRHFEACSVFIRITARRAR